MSKLTSIEGIGESYAAQLAAAGVSTTEQLLAIGGEAAGRQQLAEKTGISGKLILKWVNRADLSRVKGIGGEYADLLECAGVDTVPELAQRRADNLHGKILAVNAEKKLVRNTPTLAQIEAWVDQAKRLPRMVHH